MSRLKPSTILLTIVVLIIAFSSSIGVLAFNYIINDFTVYPIPNISKPQKGVTFQDPTFHTDIVRITDSAVDFKGYASCGYPKYNIENADGTMLIIQSYKYPGWFIINANPPYNVIRELPGGVNQNSLVGDKDPDVRWDNSDPNILYSTYTTQFLKFNVKTGERTVLHDFKVDNIDPHLVRVYTCEEGDGSDDRRYWAFALSCYDATRPSNTAWYGAGIVVYDKDFNGKDNGAVLSVLKAANPLFKGWNFVSMSPSGKYVWVGAPPSYIYPRDFSSMKTIQTHGHVAMAIDKLGREVLVDSIIDPIYGSTVDWARMSDIETGEQWLLAPLGENGGCHWSGNAHDRPGWAVYSDYYSTQESKDWSASSVFMVELVRLPNLKLPDILYATKPDLTNRARVWRLAHTHMLKKDYSDDPFAKINKKGTKVFFGSGWGNSYQDGPYDVYQINLPSTWYQDLVGYIPPTVSISATPLNGKPPLTVNFTGIGKSDGTVVSYTWNFGDGTTSNQQSVSHTYETPGSYTATFKVTNDKGATGSANVTINVLKSDTTPPTPPKGVKILK